MSMYDRIWLKGDIFEPNDELNQLGIYLNEIEFQTKDILNYMNEFYIEKNNHNEIRIYPVKDTEYLWEEILELKQINFYEYMSNPLMEILKINPNIHSIRIECKANLTSSIITNIEGDVQISFKDGKIIKTKLTPKPHFYQNTPPLLNDYVSSPIDHTKSLQKEETSVVELAEEDVLKRLKECCLKYFKR